MALPAGERGPRAPACIDDLPADVLSRVFVKVPFADRITLPRVCKAWDSALQQPSCWQLVEIDKDRLFRAFVQGGGVAIQKWVALGQWSRRRASAVDTLRVDVAGLLYSTYPKVEAWSCCVLPDMVPSLRDVEWRGRLPSSAQRMLAACQHLTRLVISEQDVIEDFHVHELRSMPKLQVLELAHAWPGSHTYALFPPEPAPFGPPTALTRLRLSNPEGFTDGMTQLSRLRTLKVEGYPDTEPFPACLAELRQLRSLDFGRAYYPDGDGALAKALPVGVSRLTALTSLRLAVDERRWRDELEYPGVSDALNLAAASGLRSLERLSLAGFPELALPDGGTALRSLRALQVHSYGLSSMPDSVSTLTGLEHLDFKGCAIRAVPRWIGRLARLACLNLGRQTYDFTEEGEPEEFRVPLQLAELRCLRKLELSRELGGAMYYSHNVALVVDLGDGDAAHVTLDARTRRLEVTCPWDRMDALRPLMRVLEAATRSAAHCPACPL